MGVIKATDLLATVHQQRKGEVMLRAELRVFLAALRIDAEDLDAATDRFAPVLPELAELFGSTGRIVAGVEDEDHRASAQSGEGDEAAGVVGEREVGSLRASG
jgi:hypothetical protein